MNVIDMALKTVVLPEDARVFVDSVEFEKTGCFGRDGKEMVDAHVHMSVVLPSRIDRIKSMVVV